MLNLIFLILIGVLLYKLSTYNFNYWKKKGVPYLKPLPFIGNFLDVLTFRCSIGQYLANLYKEYKTPYFGIYVFSRPCLVINDVELIHSVCVKDFNYFCDRNVSCDPEVDPIFGRFLPVMNNPEWRKLRAKVTPLFSPSRLRHMVDLINDVADEMVVYIKSNMDKSYLQTTEVTTKYSIDVIATCAFGIKAHCFENENSKFLEIGRRMFDFNLRNAFVHSLYFLMPSVAQRLKLTFLDSSAYDFLRKMFWKAYEERDMARTKRNDLIDIIIQNKEETVTEDEVKLEGDAAVATAALLYIAGFETLRNALAFCLYTLCLNKDLQCKVRDEIKSVLSHHKKITYVVLQDLKYTDKVINETLRQYPPIPFIDRTCVMDYTIPNTDIVIEKGTSVFIPLLGIHRDSEFYPNPERFDPERYSDRNDEKFGYIPFGIGPRACIGTKFATIELKIALMRILLEFDLERCAETPVPVEFEPKCVVLSSKAGLPIKFKKLANQ